jgi:hypothetical protein
MERVGPERVAHRPLRCCPVVGERENSLWVRGEAAHAFERGCYVPVSIDDTEPPKLFKQIQTPSISDWVNRRVIRPMETLKNAISSLIDKPKGYDILESVNPEESVEAEHLHLIHSCWRVDKKSKFGLSVCPGTY